MKIPDFSLVVLIGASGSGKSTFARRWFLPTEIVSSDWARGLVADDELDQSVTPDAFALVHAIAGARLKHRRLAVVDATNVRADDRANLVRLARDHHALPVALVFDVPERVALDRNAARPDRRIPPRVVHGHVAAMRKSVRNLQREGFRVVYVIRSEAEADAATIEREPLYCDRRMDAGPFDIIGDVHGCLGELRELLETLGYTPQGEGFVHPDGRRAIFLGDLVDRGPDSPGVLRTVMAMVATGNALAVPGNHDIKLMRKLRGADVKVAHGLAATLEQIAALPEGERQTFERTAAGFIDGLISHLWLDRGRLVVAHAGMKAEMTGRGSGAVRDFALYGETTGETDEYGLPVRFDWSSNYRGNAAVVYGHTPVVEAQWVNNTICIDTGCVYGGALTALRYPERELVSVAARATYVEALRPFETRASVTAQQSADRGISLEEVSGRRTIATRLAGPVRVEPENAAAALEVMSRYGIDPRWMIYLPPTMSPSETSQRDGFLEHLGDALTYYSKAGVDRVVVEEKHMGSRAVAVLARDAVAARAVFAYDGPDRDGAIYTRTGRPFFETAALESELLARLREAANRVGLWERLNTSWLCLDGELMPWSFKAQGLIDRQYAPAGRAAVAGTGAAREAFDAVLARGIDAGAARAAFAPREQNALAYDAAWRRYVRPVRTIDDVTFAPFHVMASAGAVHADKPHDWHMGIAHELANAASGSVGATPFRIVDLSDESQRDEACAWWETLTDSGGEGAVCKPLAFVGADRRTQPAVKSRGREYLRIIYGPDYTLPHQLDRLRVRGLGGKRRLASLEFALGIESLERFVRGEPLRRVHECAFALLALESEPIDPRL